MADDISFYEILEVLKISDHYYEPSGYWIQFDCTGEHACDGAPTDEEGDNIRVGEGQNFIPSGTHPQGYKLHVGFRTGDAVGVLGAVLPILIRLDIPHKIVSSSNYKEKLDAHPTQRGKHIAIYAAKITPDMIRDAENGDDRRLKEAIGSVRRLYQLLDMTLHLLIKTKQIRQFKDVWSSTGVGTDKYMDNSHTKMVGYRLGSFCDDYLYAYDEDRLTRYHDARNFYKKIEIFQDITLVASSVRDPEPHQNEISQLRGRLRSKRELFNNVKQYLVKYIAKSSTKTSTKKLLQEIIVLIDDENEKVNNSLIQTREYRNIDNIEELNQMKDTLDGRINKMKRMSDTLLNVLNIL